MANVGDVKKVKGENGNYLVKTLENGYSITKEGETTAMAVSYTHLAALLPQALLGAFAGVYVDRWNRKWTMIGADSFAALCSGIIALLFYLDIVELWHIYILRWV